MYDSSAKLVTVLPFYCDSSISWHVLVCDRLGVRRKASLWSRDSPIDVLFDINTPVELGYVYVPHHVFIQHVEKHFLCFHVQYKDYYVDGVFVTAIFN